MEGQPVAPQDQQGKQGQHQQSSQKTQFLHHNGKHKVIFRLRDVKHFLHAVAQPTPQKTAGAHGNQGLAGLIGQVLPRPLPQLDTGQHVWIQGNDHHAHQKHQHTSGYEPAQMDARGKEHRRASRQNQQCAG